MQTIHFSARDVADLASAVTGQGRPLRFRVSGASMHPAIRTGDRVVVAPVDLERLDQDDIVMIDGERPLIHRIVRVDRRSGVLITRGDSLVHEDPPTHFGNVIGRIVSVDRPFLVRPRMLLEKCKRFAIRILQKTETITQMECVRVDPKNPAKTE